MTPPSCMVANPRFRSSTGRASRNLGRLRSLDLPPNRLASTGSAPCLDFIRRSSGDSTAFLSIHEFLFLSRHQCILAHMKPQRGILAAHAAQSMHSFRVNYQVVVCFTRASSTGLRQQQQSWYLCITQASVTTMGHDDSVVVPSVLEGSSFAVIYAAKSLRNFFASSKEDPGRGTIRSSILTFDRVTPSPNPFSRTDIDAHNSCKSKSEM